MLMSALLAVEAWGPVAALRTSTVAYPVVNALHILGICLLVGVILALDARVLGIWRGSGWRTSVAELSPVAAAGLLLAIATGALLFTVRASRYIDNPALLTKWALVAFGLVNVFVFHRAMRRSQDAAPSFTLRLCAAISAATWVGAVFAGRWIAFAG
jgi:hypothetical protein